MAGLSALSDAELQMYHEEAAIKAARGETIEKIARDFKWPLADVRSLVTKRSFKNRLSELNPEITLDVGDDSIDEALEYIDSRMSDYVKRLDYYAMNAQSEQVAFNALVKLISMRKVDEAAENVELVRVEERHETRLLKAIAEAFGGSAEPAD
jgi:hypothetical protein